MTRVRGRGALLLLLALASAGCEGTEVGNPDVEPISLSLTAHSTSNDVAIEPQPDPASADEDAGSDVSPGTAAPVTVEQLWVSLGAVRFVLDDACDKEPGTRTTLPGPIVAELAAEPAALSAQLPEADYCSVRVSFERASDADASTPQELVGYSVMLKGRRADGVPFRIRSRDKPDFVLRSKDAPFHLASDATPLFLAFDAGTWLAGIDLAAIDPNADGELSIETAGDVLLRKFETNLRVSLSLFKDADKNGALDGDEASVPLAM
jgi:hypothetical protein